MRVSALCTAVAAVLVLHGCTEKTLSPTGTAASVAVDLAEATLLVGDTLELMATVLDAEGEPLTHRIIEWASSDPSVATVASGRVTAVGRGPVTIYAAAEALVDSTVLTVVQPFNAIRVDAGVAITCAVTAAAEGYCWGDSWGGTLGNGIGYSEVWRPSLIAGGIQWSVVTPGGDNGIGFAFTCGASTGGTAYCWGNNAAGIFGSSIPQQSFVPLALPDTGAANSVVAGVVTSCILGVNRVRCFGSRFSGVYPTTYSAPPALQSLTAGGVHLCGLTAAGSAYCWGENDAGQLGDGTTTSRSTPTAVAGSGVYASIDGGRHATCAVDGAGVGWCWGENDQGQLGEGTQVGRAVPTRVSGGIAFRVISTGEAHSCGVSTAGIAYCWGNNSSGQLGDGTSDDRLAPVEIAGSLRFLFISAGYAHTCGVTDQQRVYCWGNNFQGELGNESNTNSYLPVAVWAP